MTDTKIKQAKAEILRTAGNAEPPASYVAQDGIMDILLKEYFNPASQLPQAAALQSLTAGARVFKEGANISQDQVKAILDKYKP